MFWSSQWSLYFWFSNQYPIHIPLRPHSCYMPHPSHSSWRDNSNYTWRGVQVMKLLIMQFSPTSVNSPLFGPNILNTLISNTLSLCSSSSFPRLLENVRQSRTTEKGWSSILVVGRGTTNSSP
jgi:hypothetical protein